MRKTTSGFTIVELLIVIVVIGILAAIVVIAFNGMSARAENTKTMAAAESWHKAFKMYESEHGEMPHTGYDSCLGETYVWEYDGASSGTNQCRSTASSYYIIKPTINTALRPYLGTSQLPTPSMKAIGDSTTWARGLIYVTPTVGGTFRLLVTLSNTSTCPSLAGLSSIGTTTYGTGITCQYPLGTRLR